MTRSCAGWLALMVAAGCSPVADYSNVPDAAIDAPATTPPMLVSSVPENMQAQVSVLTPISLFFDRRLDEASVTAMTVRLRYTAGYGWVYQYANVSYDDAAKKIALVPTVPMYNAYRYEVRVDGVSDLAGNTLNGGSITFLTYVNEQTFATYFSSSTNAINQVYRYQLGANGRLQKGVYYNGPGLDMLWFTPDDEAGCCPWSNSYAPDGRQLEYRSYSVGPDNKPNTADDVLSNLSKYDYDARGLMTEYSNMQAGPDGVLGTADDTIASYVAYRYDDNGFQISFALFDHPGTDNTWKTPDDRTTNAGNSWTELTNDAFGNKTRQIYRRVGADLAPRTADDQIVQVIDYRYDSYGYITRTVFYSAPGPDSMWLTADDSVGGWTEYERDADGLQTAFVNHNNAGADGMWLTADDPISFRQTFMYTATRQLTELTAYDDPGADAMWGTVDDVINGYQTHTYDANGNRVERKTYRAGLDGVYKTADDRVAFEADYNLAK